jgi:hypothetical protein
VSAPPNPRRLNSGEWADLDDIASRFEEACRGGAAPDLNAFLPPSDSPLRPAALAELIKIDLEAGWRAGRGTVLEDYLRRFPELGPPDLPPTDLLAEEYRVRHAYGDRPAVDDYRRRFPRRAEELERTLRENPHPTRISTAETRGGATNPPPAARPTVRPVPDTKPPATAPARPGGVEAGSGYVLFERIGSGQFGEVFYAEAPGGHPAAVKRSFRTLDDEASRRDLAALELLRTFTHPFLLEMHASWVHEGRLYIAMQLADGCLSDRFAQCKEAGLPGIPRDELIEFFAEAAEALDYMHGQHILHRDIKPANLLRHRGHAKVADFGLARLLEADQAGVTFCGTPTFIPPEVWESKGSFQSDQYSLACTYVEMRLGRPAFPGRSLFELARQHREDAPQLGDLPAPERAVVAKALAKKPEDRYPSCRAFAKALREAAAPAPPARKRGPGLGAMLIAPVACALFVLGAYVYRWAMPSPPPPPPPAEEAFLPPNCVKAEDGPNESVESEGRLYWKRILLHRDGAGPIEFVLVNSRRPEDPRTFYVMRDKVSRDLFRAGLRDPEMQKLLTEFRKLDRARLEKDELPTVQPDGKIQETWAKIKANDPAVDPEGSLPATGVTVAEAYCFARWLAGNFGNLPTVQQWDKAAGRFDGRPGPSETGGETGGVAVGLKGPRAVGTSDKDRSVYGCRDMAGNGQELTRSFQLGDHSFPLKRRAGGDDDLLLRGQKWSLPVPFTFPADPNQATMAGVSGYNEADPDVGFRVVLELPLREASSPRTAPP